MIDYNPLYKELENIEASDWVSLLKEIIPFRLNRYTHGDLAQWQETVNSLPSITGNRLELNQQVVSVLAPSSPDHELLVELRRRLMDLHPWRKGPFNIHGVEIDAEWHSDKKWLRLESKISPLKNRVVLDIGCGNGYYGWRMLGAGAKIVVGIEPFLKNVIQYFALNKYLGPSPFYVLPLGIEDMPEELGIFDTVFSMGVFYHRRSPFDHLIRLKSFLKTGGELVLETLVIDGDENTVLVPEGRYAKMRNVWFLPTVPTLEAWLKRAGYQDISCIDISTTTSEEQRRTDWMTFESLADFLDPLNSSLTIEGLPAPKRAIITAKK